MSDPIRTLSLRKGTDVTAIARQAAGDHSLLVLLLKNTRSKNETLRYNCYRVLLEVSTATPAALSEESAMLLEMLGSTNNYFRFQAVSLIANILSADAGLPPGTEDRYLGLVADPSVMIASHLALNAGRIARARAELRGKVTAALLEAARSERGDKDAESLHAALVEAFASYFTDAPRREEILAYVEGQASGGSPKARKAARDFLRVHAPERT